MITYSIKALQNMNFDEIEAELLNNVYESTAILEQLENAGMLKGNGHHLRQKVSGFAQDILKERWINK